MCKIAQYWLESEKPRLPVWIERHLNHCRDCRASKRLHRTYERLVSTVREIPVPPAQLEWSQIRARLNVAEAPPAARPLVWQFALSGVAVIALLGIGMALWFNRPSAPVITQLPADDSPLVTAPPTMPTEGQERRLETAEPRALTDVRLTRPGEPTRKTYHSPLTTHRSPGWEEKRTDRATQPSSRDGVESVMGEGTVFASLASVNPPQPGTPEAVPLPAIQSGEGEVEYLKVALYQEANHVGSF